MLKMKVLFPFIIFSLCLIFYTSKTYAYPLKTAAQDSDLFKYDVSNMKAPGFCMELMQKVHTKDPSLVFQFIHTELPLLRIERELENMHLDVFFCLLKTPEREKKISFLPIPLYQVQHVLVSMKKKNIEIRNYAELKEFSIKNEVLVQQNSALATFLKSQGIRVDDGTKDYAAMLKKLIAGRGHVLYGQRFAIEKAIKKEKLSNFFISKVPLKEESLYVAYSKLAPEKIMRRLEKVLKQLENQGELKRLLKKYSE